MVGILTYHFAHNYGAMLQAYALYTFLNNCGIKSEIINYCPSSISRQYSISVKTLRMNNFWWKLPNNLRRRKQYTIFEEFRKDMLKNKDVISIEQIKNKYDKIIVGSDQVWNTSINHCDPNYYLEFADKSVKKVGYSISLGSIKMSKKMRELIDNNIGQFERLSFREQSTVSFIDSLYKKQYAHTCDPVFLIDSKEWINIEKKPHTYIPKNYILYYSLHNDSNLIDALLDISRREQLPIVSIHPLCKKARFADYNLIDVGPCEFLWLINHAEYIASNSFHATAFSIILKKKAILRPHPILGDRNVDLLRLVQGDESFQAGDVFRFEEAYFGNLEKLISFSSDFLTSIDNTKYLPIDTKGSGNHPVILGLKAKDLESRMTSQSGGAASVIAEYFIRNGAVVYGCGFDDNLNVTYIRITNLEQLSLIKGSKYVRARLGDTFQKILMDLKNGKKVLFIGNACNVAGILKFVDRVPEKENLYTMDFVCHGTPSHSLYREYLRMIEQRQRKKIRLFNFRYKSQE